LNELKKSQIGSGYFEFYYFEKIIFSSTYNVKINDGEYQKSQKKIV